MYGVHVLRLLGVAQYMYYELVLLYLANQP